MSLCHCTACQKRTGSAFRVAAFYDRSRVQSPGETTTFRRSSDSGFDLIFHFCPACGSTVFWQSLRKPDMVAVTFGGFADTAFPARTQAVHAGDQHAWVATDEVTGGETYRAN